MAGVLRLFAAGTALALAVSACSSGGQDTAGSPQAGPVPDLGVIHVHGLGVDPADGVLYAATHTGLFRLPPTGAATRVAERQQDTMGFTVVGPRTFLGSGHPDFQKDPQLPTRLGLIRSTDAGQTWTNVSLSGKADFHTLRSIGASIYGWDATSGRLLGSGNRGKTWDTRSAVNLRDFVVNPDVPDALLGTTPKGLVRSTDGGRTFRRATGPRLVVLAWEKATGVVGLDQTGTVHASADGGTTWTKRGTLGAPPEALAAEATVLYAAVADKGIFTSRDGGATWTVRYQERAAAR